MGPFTDDYERRTRNQSAKSDQEGAFVTDANNKKDLECHNCKKRGYVKADYWAPGGGKEG